MMLEKSMTKEKLINELVASASQQLRNNLEDILDDEGVCEEVLSEEGHTLQVRVLFMADYGEVGDFSFSANRKEGYTL